MGRGVSLIGLAALRCRMALASMGPNTSSAFKLRGLLVSDLRIKISRSEDKECEARDC